MPSRKRAEREVGERTLRWIALAWLVVSIAACGAGEVEEDAATDAMPTGSQATPELAFVDEASCAGCHAAEHEAWRGSHHDAAMQPVDGASLAGDFDDAVFEQGGVTTRFFMKDGKPFVRTEGPDGTPADFEVAYVFGTTPLQQVLLALPGGRLQALPIAWDTRSLDQGGQRWFSLYPDERIPAGDPLHWSGPYLNWNSRCAECHSTNLRERFDVEADRYQTRWSQIDVGCQACHGPGSAHVGWAERTVGAPLGADAGEMGLVVDFASSDGRSSDGAAAVDQCARCHARRHRVSPDDAHGRPFLDDFAPELLREGFYHADGQIQDEVYVYGSFLQSRMYAKGVRCTDCHDPHRATLVREGDELCMGCHSATPDPRFASLKARRYDAREHHHHPAASEGARCVACHMPERIYMGVDGRRDHGFRVPRPDLAAKLGTPDACASCHADRDAAWAARVVAGWFPESTRRGPHFAEVLHAARLGEASAVPGLVALARDAEAAAIVRATAVDLLPRFGPAGWEALATSAADPEPLVRIAAARGLAALPPPDRIVAGVPLLDDPLRAVRTGAVASLVSLPADALPSRARNAFRSALFEYTATQRAQLDTSEANLNLGALAERAGDETRAEALHRAALRIDPGFAPARTQLASLLARIGRPQDAVAVLRAGFEHGAELASLHYALGLALAGTGELAEAALELGRAAELEPRHARAAYNQGLALQQLGRRDEARVALGRARSLAPDDPDIAYALAVLHVQQGEFREALPHAESAATGNPAARTLVDRIRGELAASPGADPPQR